MAERRLMSVFKDLAKYEPAEADKESLKSLERLCGLIYMHVSGLLSASGGDPDASDWVYPDFDALDTSETAEERRAKIFENPGEPMSAEQWMTLIIRKRKLTMMDAEQQGFARLLSGYLPDESGQVLRARFQNAPQNGVYQSVFDQSIALETKGTVDRLAGREIILKNINITTSLQWFVHSLLKTIHAIRFAIDWESLSRAEKQKYTTDIFNQYEAEFVSQIHTVQQYKKKFESFKKRHERVVTSRNDLKKMFFKFHAALFFDPCWAPTTSYDSSTTGRTSSFPATLKLVMDDMNPIDNAILKQTQDAFLQLIGELLPESSQAYVVNFLAKYPPRAALGN